MKYRQIHSKYYGGVDVHPNKSQICVMDKTGQILLNKNFRNNFDNFNQIIQPFLPEIVIGCESTYTYYWLADGCHQAGIPFYLGHALYMKAISKKKQKDDKIDARTITDMLRTSFFPEAYPYPREMRPTRDLLRRRHRLVRIRAEAYSHIQMTAHQYTIENIGPRQVKNKEIRQTICDNFKDQDLKNIIASDLDVIEVLDPLIDELEKKILDTAKSHNHLDLVLLMSIPGVGKMLAMIILYETHDVTRFKKVQQYASYCRVVRCDRTSSGKKVDRKNQKIGNPYLKWAFSQIIIAAQHSSERIGKYYQRLESKYGRPKARARIAHKFCVAAYFMLKNGQPFDEKQFVQSSQ
jgi:transposase